MLSAVEKFRHSVNSRHIQIVSIIRIINTYCTWQHYTIHIQYLYMQTQTLNIALPKNLVKEVDIVAKKEYRNRSELIREALRVYLTDKLEWEQIFEAGEKAMKKMGIKSEEEIDRIVYEYRHGKKSD